MKEEKDEVVYAKSTAQLDAERRAEEREQGGTGNGGPVVEYRQSMNPDYGVEDEEGYIGVSPEYRTSADERQSPLPDDEDWQRKLMVEPAEDAGEPTLPYVSEARPGGPEVKVRREEAPADSNVKAAENQVATRAAAVPAAKSAASAKSHK